VLVKLCTAPLPLASALATDLPPAADQWFYRALSREPGERFQSAAELSSSLAVVCGLSMPSQHSGEISIGGLGSGQHSAPALTPFDRTTPATQVSQRASETTAAPISRTPPPEERAPEARRRTGGLAVIAAVAILAVVAAGLAITFGGGEEARATHDAAKVEVAPAVPPTPAAPPAAPASVVAPQPSPGLRESDVAALAASGAPSAAPPAAAPPVKAAAAPRPKKPAQRPRKPEAKPAEPAKAFIRPGHDIGF